MSKVVAVFTFLHTLHTRMKCKTIDILAFIIKAGIFVTLFIVFYVFYFTDVARKYAEKNTNLAFSQETLE